LNPVDLSRASGSFHGGAPDPPYAVGSEGVARLDGGMAYFNSSVAPFGSMAERALVAEEELVPLPEGLEAAHALCYGIAGLAAWLGLEGRAHVGKDDTVLVLGATGTVGLIAVQAAGLLGAARVVAAGRDADRLARAAELGASATVALKGDDAERLRRACAGEGPTVVLDPLWGKPALAALEAAAPHARIVQLGQSAGARAAVPSSVIRGKALSLVGFSNFRVPRPERVAAFRRMAEHAARGELTCDYEKVPLERAAEAWERQAAGPGAKLAVVP